MKFAVEVYVLIGLLILTISISLMNTGSILPYSNMKQHYKYEGFKENAESNSNSNEDETLSSGDMNDKLTFDSETVSAKTLNADSKSSSKEETTPKKKSSESSDTSYSMSDNKKDSAASSKKSVTFDESSLSLKDSKESSKDKKESMQSMNPSPVDSESSLDMFSLTKGSYSCTASPYSNSNGYLCMNQEQQRLLYTRGGNQTGGSIDVSPS